jgi:hypothetical protein
MIRDEALNFDFRPVLIHCMIDLDLWIMIARLRAARIVTDAEQDRIEYLCKDASEAVRSAVRRIALERKFFSR